MFWSMVLHWIALWLSLMMWMGSKSIEIISFNSCIKNESSWHVWETDISASQVDK